MRRESRAERERRERRGARDTPGRESRDTVCLTVSLSSAVCLWQLRVGVSFSSNKAAGGDVRREEHGVSSSGAAAGAAAMDFPRRSALFIDQ